MPKMPTNTTLVYDSGAISSSTWTGIGNVNLVRDLAAINRHNVTHTNSKGVPYVYRCAITLYPKVTTGDKTQIFNEDANMVQVLSVGTVPNSWVARNAGVKMHAARENMFKQQGIRKKERGAYSRTIRYTWDASPDTFLVPQSGIGAQSDYNLGTWDYSALKQENGDISHIQLMSADGLLSMYLDSRKQISSDSNSDSDSTNQPTDDSVIRRLLSPTLGISTKDDDVTALARDEQDNPPYQLNNDGDAIQTIESARLFIGPNAGFQATAVFDAPYGMLDLQAANGYIDEGTSTSRGVEFKIEVLAIYEM